MELKLSGVYIVEDNPTPFNRTSMELKQAVTAMMCPLSLLLIEPVWN